ncbi:hypothetical protein AURDEDRAFT_150156, partial [Auricularia subglabra TFB-10046 SS5]
MRKLVSKSKSRYNLSLLGASPGNDAQSSATVARASTTERPQSMMFNELPIVGRHGELTRLIESISSDNVPEYVAAVREICLRTTASDAAAREASIALYNQLSRVPVSLSLRAIRLWALMLRYCSSEKFLHKTSRKDWLGAVKVICLSQDQHQAARSRAYEVVAGARHAFPTNPGFRDLWLRVRREVDPEEGIPFTNPLFSLPNTQSKFDADLAADPEGHATVMQRLVVSCELARDRARRLNELLDIGALDDTAEVIIDVHDKCVASRDFIQSQLPWATVNAEHSIERSAAATNQNANDPERTEHTREQTFEEQLLGMLLEANEELNDVLWRHEVETAIPEAAAPSPPSSPENRPSGSGLSRRSQDSQPSGSGLSHSHSAGRGASHLSSASQASDGGVSAQPSERPPASPASASIRPLPRPPSSMRPPSQQVPPPPYAP